MIRSLGLSLCLLACAPLASLSCGGDSKPAATSAGALDPFFLKSAPDGAVPLLALRKSARNGDEVVATGRVKDFVGGLAAFTMIDSSLRACSDAGDPMEDSCTTPWDYCCIPSEEVTAASATVEFRDGEALLKEELQGFRGLDHLDTVVVRGTVERDTVGNLTIVAKNFAFTPNAK